jgi:hypothetical protein
MPGISGAPDTRFTGEDLYRVASEPALRECLQAEDILIELDQPPRRTQL